MNQTRAQTLPVLNDNIVAPLSNHGLSSFYIGQRAKQLEGMTVNTTDESNVPLCVQNR